MGKWLERVSAFPRGLGLGCAQGGKGNKWSSVSGFCLCLSLRSSRLEGGSQKLAAPARVPRAVALLAGEAKVGRLLP